MGITTEGSARARSWEGNVNSQEEMVEEVGEVTGCSKRKVYWGLTVIERYTLPLILVSLFKNS